MVKGAERVIRQSMPREGRSKAIDLNTSNNKVPDRSESITKSGNL